MSAGGSVRRKWIGALLVVALVPLALVSLLAAHFQRRGLERAERELEAAVVDDAARSLGTALGDVSRATERVASTLVDPRIKDDDMRLALAKNAVVSVAHLERVVVFDRDGAVIDAIVGRQSADSKLPATLAADERVTAPRWFVGARDAKTYARYVVPLEVDGAPSGWIVGELEGSTLARTVGGLSQDRFGRRDRVVVVSSELLVLASDEASPYRTGQSAAAFPLLERARIASLTQPIVVTGSFRHASGEAFVGTVRVVPEHRWAVIVERPESEAYGALASTQRALLLAFVVSAVAAALAGWRMGTRATLPIRQLNALTRRYAQRDFTALNPVSTRDELQDLGDAMASMAKDIAAGETEIARRATVEAGLARYLPRPVALAIAEGRDELDLKGTRRRVAVLFADVAGFTSFAERESPEQVVLFLNELFTVLSEVVFRHDGMLDKLIGDCVMAIFGARGEADVEASALACAEDMHRFVEAGGPAWKERFGIDVRLGIGIACGEALVGNLGSDTRVEYTAIGDTVNVASRLEGLAGPGKTLVTSELATSADFTFVSLGQQQVRGKSETVEIFEVAS